MSAIEAMKYATAANRSQPEYDANMIHIAGPAAAGTNFREFMKRAAVYVIQ